MNNQEKYFYTPDDLPVLDLDQIYMTSSAYFETGFKNTRATFDLLVRDMPKHRNFMVFTGLEEMIRGIMAWRYSDKHIKLLRKNKLISRRFGEYLRKFKFSGTVYAMREGTIFFPGEPVLRITAPIIECNLLTAFLITALSSNTPYSTKFIRSVFAARGISVIGTAPQRATSFEQAFKCSRAAFIVGSNQLPSPIVREKLGVPMGDMATIAYHAFIKSYPTELEAMRVAANQSKNDLSLMIDTYDFAGGLANAMEIAKEFKKQGKILKLVIDSGNLLSLARYARRILDQNGFEQVRLTLAGNLDEYKISKLVKAGVPANTFIVNTEAQMCSDDPKLEAVYKLCEIIRERKREYKMKLARGKVSLPGRKQVYRLMKGGCYHYDIIGLEGESLGEKLLKPMIVRGKLVRVLPSVVDIRVHVQREIQKLPLRLLEVLRESKYKVAISPKLKNLIQKTKEEHLSQYK